MRSEEYKTRLLTCPESQNQLILDEFFHAGESFCFRGDPAGEAALKATVQEILASGLFDEIGLTVRFHPLQLVVCGSAHLGFSAAPKKLGNAFRPGASDIDIAIVNPELFEAWWAELQQAPQIAPGTQRQVAENLLFGFIDPSTVCDSSPIGRIWWKSFGNLRMPSIGSVVRARLYKNYWSMQNYHIRSINEARNQLQGKVV